MATSAEICGDGHKLRYFCSNCIRFFCGECSTNIHSRKGGLKDHDVEPIEDRLTIEAQKGDQLIEVLTKLSDNAEVAAIAKDAIDDKSLEVLSRFVAHVEQLIMSSQITRDAQFLYGFRRDCNSLLQLETLAIRSYDPEIDQVGALVSRLSSNRRLVEQIERNREAVENAAGARELNVVDVIEAIYEAAVALKKQNSLHKLFAALI